MIRIPSKTFLLGEYIVLKGGPALVLTHGPFFKAEAQAKSLKSPFNVASPAAQIAKKLRFDASTVLFTDPHNGQGGFGGSSAEFLAVLAQDSVKTNFKEAECWKARELYLSVASGSGVDVLVQAFGSGEENLLVAVDLEGKKLKPLNIPSLGAELKLFRTGQKIATHEHLKKVEPPHPDDLAPLVQKAEGAFYKKDKTLFAEAMNAYGDAMAKAGLLAAHSGAAVKDAREIPGMLAAKGCGAMGADVIALLQETGSEIPEAFKAKHSLVEVLKLTI